MAQFLAGPAQGHLHHPRLQPVHAGLDHQRCIERFGQFGRRHQLRVSFSDACNTAQGIATSIAVMLLIPLWAMGDTILGVIWLVTKTGKKGLVARRSCGDDFRTAAVSPAPAPA